VEDRTVSDPRLLPPRYPEGVEHLNGADLRELRIPACHRCGAGFWPSDSVCPHDFSPDLEWRANPGNGAPAVISFPTVVGGVRISAVGPRDPA
jgi:uncharacterized OB-fold protein